MAFFGLSALGPQNSFVASRAEIFNCSLFDLDEFVEAFNRVDKQKQGSLTMEGILQALELVFHGPVPPFELARVLDAFRSDGDYISKDEYARTIADLRRAGQKQGKKLDTSHTAHYNSYDEMRAARLRQRRPSQGPAELYSKPLTQLQEVGWQTATAVSKGLGGTIMDPSDRHPKRQCEETKFMGALLKGGYL